MDILPNGYSEHDLARLNIYPYLCQDFEDKVS